MWVYVGAPDESHCYLLDLPTRKPIGELLHAFPVAMNTDGSKVFCSWRPDRRESLLQKKLSHAISVITDGALSPKSREPLTDQETYWVVDLKSNLVKKVGALLQRDGAASPPNVSPDFRHAFSKPTAGYEPDEVALFDLELGIISRQRIDGSPAGWWDNTHIVIRTPQAELNLYDVTTHSNTVLISYSQIAELFDDVQLTNSPTLIQPFVQWNGRENIFYLTESATAYTGGSSYLIRVDRPDPNLTLLSKTFEFKLLGRLNETRTKYLYGGGDVGIKGDGVYVRDLTTGDTNTVAPFTGEDHFSYPHFYNDTIVYTRSNAIWQTSLSTSNTVRLFPTQ